MKNIPVIIDTDPGTDDAVALLVARVYRLNVDTVVSVYGNVSHKYTHRNLCDLNAMLGINARIIKGASAPLDGSGFSAEHVHGENGVGRVSLPQAELTGDSDDFAKELYERLKELGKVDYVALGPLTNLATVIKHYPDSIKYVNILTIMGAGFEISNIPHNAEFNIGCDPQAARIVFESGIETKLIPLDVTHKIALSADEISYITDDELGGIKGSMADILRYNYKTAIAKNDEGALVHDATAVIAYRYPEKFKGLRVGIKVDGYGATTYTENGNVTIYLDADRKFVVEQLKLCYGEI